ncbi:MAG: primosomal replication protein [Alkalimonas sp.]|nr:primosomal replication protein [Alkalimonas sp.]
MSQLHELRARLDQLRQQALQLDKTPMAGKPIDWFQSELFSCHSPFLTDYVDEALQQLTRLQHFQSGQQHVSAEQQHRLAERIAAQCHALTRAFANHQTRRSFKVGKRKTQQLVQQITQSSRDLYQQLSQYKEFEQRLQDMLRLAQQQNQPVQQQLALQARLGRCRRAISDVEQQIQFQEQRKR